MIQKTIHWTAKNGDDAYDFNEEIIIHPLNTGIVIINCPGAGGNIDGYNNKYVTLADYMVSQNLGAVVRMSDPYNPFGWDKKLRQVMTYALENSKDICGTDTPRVYLMGTSAGASAISLLAWEYPEVEKILFLEPAAMSNKRLLQECLEKYTGEIVVVTGNPGEALGIETGRFFIDASMHASRKEIFELQDCDHNFRGVRNGRVFSQAPFYAFSDSPQVPFPDYGGGIVLYE